MTAAHDQLDTPTLLREAKNLVLRQKQRLLDPKPLMSTAEGRDEFARELDGIMQDLGDRVPGVERQEYACPGLADIPHDSVFRHKGVPRQVFLLRGHPRSGTTWSGELLNLHPKIYCAGEVCFEHFDHAIVDMMEHRWHSAHHEPWKSALRSGVVRLKRDFHRASLKVRPDAVMLGDRTPRSIDEAPLRGSPVLLVLRQPQASIVSQAFKALASRDFAADTPHTRPFLGSLMDEFEQNPDLFRAQPERLFTSESFVRELCARYRQHTMNDLRRMQEVVGGRHATRVWVYRYESLVHDCESTRAELYRFLGLDPSEALPIDQHEHTKPGFTDNNPRGFFRAGKTDEWRRYMHPKAERWIEQELGGMLRALGYSEDRREL